jgi:hypothetical protein
MTEQQVTQLISNIFLELQILSCAVAELAETIYDDSPQDSPREMTALKRLQACQKQCDRIDSLIQRLAKNK